MNDADRIEKTILKLRDLLYIKTFSINNCTKKDGNYTSIEEVDNSSSPWLNCGKNSYWGKNSTFAWFRFKIQIPKEYLNRLVILKLKSEDENAEFIVYINKELKFHLKENGEAIVKEALENVIDFKIDISALAAKNIRSDRKLRCYFIVVDEIVKKYFFYLMQTLYIARRKNTSSSILEILNKSIDMLCLEKPHSEEFDDSILKALEFLKGELQLFKDKKNPRESINCNFSIPANVNSLFVLNSLYLAESKVFDFKLVLSNIRDMMYLKEIYPNVFNAIKEKVKNKNFELIIGINSSFENSCLGETLIRNIILKKKFFLDEFHEDVNIVMFSSGNYLYVTIPKILNSLKIKYAFFEMSDIEFKRDFTWSFKNRDRISCGIYRQVNDNISFKNILNISDGNLSDTKDMPIISCFNNHEFDKLRIETLYDVSRSLEKVPTVKFHTFKDEYENIKDNLDDDLNNLVCCGDLNSNDNITCVKSRLEVLVQSVESLSIFNFLRENSCDYEAINNLWRNMDDESFILRAANNILYNLRSQICQNIESKYYTLVIFNDISFIRDEIAEFEFDGDFSGLVVKDGDGNIIPHQLNHETNKVFFLASKLPPIGYKCFYIAKGESEEKPVFFENRVIESNSIKIAYDDLGNITSLYDKLNSKEIIFHDGKCNFIEISEEDYLNNNKKTYAQFHMDSLEIMERGAIKSSIKIRKMINDSCFEQIIAVYKDILRVDFSTKIYLNDFFDIKSRFEFNINSSEYLCDTPFGISHRQFGIKNDILKKSFVCIYDDNYKIGLVNNQNCNMEVLGNTCVLTLATKKSPSIIEVDYSLYLEPENIIKNSYCRLSPITLFGVSVNKSKKAMPSMISLAWVNNDNIVLQSLKKAENSDEIVIRVFNTENKTLECLFSFYKGIYDSCECDMFECEIKKIENYANGFKFNIGPDEIKTFKFKVKN